MMSAQKKTYQIHLKHLLMISLNILVHILMGLQHRLHFLV